MPIFRPGSILAGLISICSSAVAGQPETFKTQPEVYTEFGEVTGCGLSFDVVWQDDGEHTVALTGSVITVYIIQKDSVAVLVRAAGKFDRAKSPLQDAWIETSPYGKTTDFTPGPTEDPADFEAFKVSSESEMVPSLMATSGFTLGVAFRGDPHERRIHLPPSSPEVIDVVQSCYSDLDQSIQSMQHQ